MGQLHSAPLLCARPPAHRPRSCNRSPLSPLQMVRVIRERPTKEERARDRTPLACLTLREEIVVLKSHKQVRHQAHFCNQLTDCEKS